MTISRDLMSLEYRTISSDWIVTDQHNIRSKYPFECYINDGILSFVHLYRFLTNFYKSDLKYAFSDLFIQCNHRFSASNRLGHNLVSWSFHHGLPSLRFLEEHSETVKKRLKRYFWIHGSCNNITPTVICIINILLSSQTLLIVRLTSDNISPSPKNVLLKYFLSNLS